MAAGPARNVARPRDLGTALAVAVDAPASAPIAGPGVYARYGKRAFDIATCAALLPLLAPVVALVALAVRITSGGPVLYSSARLGRDGRVFQMWKFRTMIPDADAVLDRWKDTHPELAREIHARWKLRRDPRVTALGRFLRKSSLDELPQFWNVLRGEMSIVGPRPYLARETLEPALRAQILCVRPGITGPFQVYGRRRLTPTTRMRLEAAYGADVSLLRDLGYIARTAKPLLTLDGN